MYRRCVLIRRADDRFRQAISAGRLDTPYYSPAGQEVIPAAISELLNHDDYVVTVYRGIHDMLAKGVPLKLLWAEVAGKKAGSCKGKGGPMHITYPERGVMVTTGIVGSGLPIANGLALASQIQGDGRITVCNFGDGASNIGAFHEALNLAAVWKLPVVFVCQNNGYGEHTRYDLATSAARVADRGAAYQIPSMTVDGNNPIDMWRAAREAVSRAREGGGPTLLEAKTFRFFGHVLGDNDQCMRPGELEAARAKDPTEHFRKWLLSEGHATEDALAAIEAQIKKDIEEAVAFALAAEDPSLDELTTDVLAKAQAV
jgi:TPP-dependent pyruvate/acetoin dehydrogenase alpha subunit